MRPTLTLRRTAVGLAAVTLLAACSGEAEEDPAATTAGTTAAQTTAPEESEAAEAPQADSEFCTQAGALNEELESAFTDQTDPESVEGAITAAVEGIRSIEPPEEIASDWGTFADVLEQLGLAYADVDPADPGSLTTFQERVTELQEELTGASANVETYLREQCGITGTEESAPTS